MKKTFVSNIVFCLMFLTLLFFSNCKKQCENEILQQPFHHKACLLNSNKGVVYLGTFLVGHKAVNCSGCFNDGGMRIHVDCMGTGNECQRKVYFELDLEGDTTYYSATIQNPNDLTAEVFFVMPARSLYIQGTNGQFLNIPEQTVYKDEETGAFSFSDVFYSDYQWFENK